MNQTGNMPKPKSCDSTYQNNRSKYQKLNSKDQYSKTKTKWGVTGEHIDINFTQKYHGVLIFDIIPH